MEQGVAYLSEGGWVTKVETDSSVGKGEGGVMLRCREEEQGNG